MRLLLFMEWKRDEYGRKLPDKSPHCVTKDIFLATIVKSCIIYRVNINSCFRKASQIPRSIWNPKKAFMDNKMVFALLAIGLIASLGIAASDCINLHAIDKNGVGIEGARVYLDAAANMVGEMKFCRIFANTARQCNLRG
jgi:hypothetical protein